jgi:hypothetical protein
MFLYILNIIVKFEQYKDKYKNKYKNIKTII